MASSPFNAKTLFQVRSISLPPRPHPLSAQVDELLSRLEAANAVSSSASNNINSLVDIYDLVNNVLLLPKTLQTLLHCDEKQVDEVLDQSMKLVNLCGVTQEAFLQIKEEVQELQSVLRRKRGDESSVAEEFSKYLSSMKKASKQIQRSIKELKSTHSVNNEATSIIVMLREVEAVTIRVFESLLSCLSGTKPQSMSSKWSLVSKIIHSKQLLCGVQATDTNEFEKANASLCSLIGNKSWKSSNMNAENTQLALGKLDLCIQDFEEGLECLLRRLIKTRVSLLNILSH